MIKAHIDSDGMKCLDIAGSAPTIVAEFGVIINQYYSAIANLPRNCFILCDSRLRPLLHRIVPFGSWTMMSRVFL